MTVPRSAEQDSRLTALVVDDDPDLRLAVRLGLDAAGWRVIEASTGAQAITMAERDLPDVVVLDLGLPDIDGREVIASLSSTNATASIPVVVLSGRTDTLNAGELLRAGARDYVRKPFSMDELDTRLVAAHRTSLGERALRESEARYRTLLDHMSDTFVFVYDRELRATVVAGGGLDRIGFHGPDKVGLRLDEITAPEDVDYLEGLLAAAFRGEPTSTEFFSHLSGTINALDVVAIPTPDGGGAEEILVVSRDISAQKEREHALATAELRWKTAFEAAPVAIAEMVLDGRFILVNPAFCELLGYSEEQLVAMKHADISHPDDVGLVARAIASSANSNEHITRIERRYIHASGRTVTCFVSAVAVHEADGRRARLLAYFEDISERKVNEQAFADEHRRLFDAQSIGRIGSWERDLESGESTWSDMALELFGLDRSAVGESATVLDCVNVEDREMVASAIGACCDLGTPLRVRYRATRASDGAQRWFDGLGEALYEEGRVRRVAGTVIDVTDQILAEQALQDSEVRFRLAFDTAPLAMAMIDLSEGSSELLRVNAAMCRLTGRSASTLHVLDFAAISHPDDLEANAAMLAQLRRGDVEVGRGERRFNRPDGSTAWGELSISTVTPADGRKAYAICLVEDVTVRKHVEGELVHQSLHDPLTGLPNRVLLRNRIDHALAASTRSHAPIGVLYVDLDGFKQVNDSTGHAAGDELLIEVAQRILHTLRPGDTVARLGGDEFAVVCIDVADLESLKVAADRVLATLLVPFFLAGGTHHISASIGLALSDGSSTVDKLLVDADAAMYEAKKSGKNRFATPRHEEHARASRAARLLPELHDAINDRQLVMHGQPVVDLATGATVAVETLIRWQHPVLGLLPPGQFLDVVEHSPLMIAVGDFVLSESCRMAAAWSELLGGGAPALHVNVSGRQLESGHLSRDVLIALARFAMPASMLVLELTETHMPVITNSLRTDLDRLRDRGVRIAIDDVGTGYSSLERITQLPVDILKIDLRFVAGLGNDPSCEAVVRAILSIGQAMGLSVVAEGVETPQQVELLQAYGCDTLQGYLYSVPRPEPELLHYLAGHTARVVVRPPG